MQTFRWVKVRSQEHTDFEVPGLPEGNFEIISKNSDGISIAKFSGLQNGTIGTHVQWIAKSSSGLEKHV